jgi:hypothetical protein
VRGRAAGCSSLVGPRPGASSRLLSGQESDARCTQARRARKYYVAFASLAPRLKPPTPPRWRVMFSRRRVRVAGRESREKSSVSSDVEVERRVGASRALHHFDRQSLCIDQQQ